MLGRNKLQAQWVSQWSSLAFVTLMVILLVIVAFTFTDYGITFDEPARKNFGNRVLVWYSSLFKNKAAVQDVLPNIYGGVFEIPAQLIASLTLVITGSNLFEARHLVNALVGLLGIVAVYKIGKLIAGQTAGFLSGIFLILTPRYYGHMFNNPKDIPFAVCYLFSIYSIIASYRYLPNLPKRHILTIGLFIGLTMGIRVGGAILFGYWILFLTAWFLVRHFTSYMAHINRIQIFKITIASFIAVVIAWCVMLIGWPWAQLSPLIRPLKALNLLSSFPWPHTVFYKGEFVSAKELPWDYIPTWLAITLPEFYFIAAIVGCISSRYYIRRLPNDTEFYNKLVQIGMLLFAACFPVSVLLIKNSTLYDGIRHILFIIPILSIICGISVASYIRVQQGGVTKRIFLGSMMIMVGLTLYDMITLHPYQALYFNRLIAGGFENAAQNYETDYWGNAYKEGSEWLLQNHAGDERTATVSGCSYFPDEIMRYYMEKKTYLEKELSIINIVFRLDENDFYNPRDKNKDNLLFSVDNSLPADYALASTRWMCHRRVEGKILHKVQRENVPLLYVIKPF